MIKFISYIYIMNYKTRKLIKPEDLNAGNTLYGGQLLKFVDEEAAIYAMCQLGTKNIVTKLVSTIDFVAPARQKEIIEIGVEAKKFGTTSIALHVVVRNKETEAVICDIENMVFVSVDEAGVKKPHGKTMYNEQVIKIEDFIYEISSIKDYKKGDYCICLNSLKHNSLPENKFMQIPTILKWKGNNCDSCRKIITTNNPNIKNVKVF